jgi:methyl-accepting chemotaxis protein
MAGRRWPIRYKLGIILVVPLLTLVVVSVTQVAASLRQVEAADRVSTQAVFAVTTATTIHELQRERGLSGGYVGSNHK